MSASDPTDIVGLFVMPDGQSYPNQTLVWRKASGALSAYPGKTSVPEPVAVVTGPTGLIACAFLPGVYHVSVETADGARSVTVTVPESEEEIDFSALPVNEAVPDVAVAVQAASAAIAAMGDSEAAAAVALAVRIEVELAAAAALAGGTIYDTTAAGIAGTSSGDYFFVKSIAAPYLASFWKNVGGVATDQNMGLVSAEGVFAHLPKMKNVGIGASGEEAWLVSQAGVRVPLATGNIRFNKKTRKLTLNDVAVQFTQAASGVRPSIMLQSPAGIRHYLAQSPKRSDAYALAAAAGGVISSFSQEELAAAEVLGRTYANDLNTVDIAALNLSGFRAGANLIMRHGQSFLAQADQSGREYTAARVTSAGWMHNTYSIGPDTRGVGTTTYVTFNGNSRVLFPVSENQIGPTGTDWIYPDAQVLAGDYPSNSRGGDGAVIWAIAYESFRQKWTGETALPVGQYNVAVNLALADAGAADVFAGNGLARCLDALAVFENAVTLLDGAAPSTLGAGNGPDVLNLALIDVHHGQANDGSVTVTQAEYEAFHLSFYDAICAQVLADWGQTAKPAMLMVQTGGPKYGGYEMTAALAQNALSDSFTGSARYMFCIASDTEGFSTFNVADSAGFAFPNPLDGHPIWPAKALREWRSAIGTHYLMDRKQNLWLPKPIAALTKGKTALVVVPSMTPPLNIVPMPNGCVLELLDSLGFAFKATDTFAAPRATILSARVVPGYSYLVEVTCAEDLDGYPHFTAGEGEGAEKGMVCLRDSFVPPKGFVIEVEMNDRQRRWARLGASGDGFLEVIDGNHPIGRYIRDVGPMDVRNPCRRTRLTTQPITAIL